MLLGDTSLNGRSSLGVDAKTTWGVRMSMSFSQQRMTLHIYVIVLDYLSTTASQLAFGVSYVAKD